MKQLKTKSYTAIAFVILMLLCVLAAVYPEATTTFDTGNLAWMLSASGLVIFIGSYLLLKLTHYIIPLRVYPEHEWMGLDMSQHRESIYDKEEQ